MKKLDIFNPFDAPVYHTESAGSTMELSKNLANSGALHGTVIAADFQEGGMGRVKGRRWEAEKGKSLLFTIMLKYPSIKDIPLAITLRAGLATAIGIENFCVSLKDKIFIKWPNDIMICDKSHFKKASGILVKAENGNVHIGIGVNVLQKKFSGQLKQKATSIRIAAGNEGGSIGCDERFILLENILKCLHDELIKTDFQLNWKERLEKRLYKKGEKIKFGEGKADSKKIINGILAGIGNEGGLQIIPQGEAQARSFFNGELIEEW